MKKLSQRRTRGITKYMAGKAIAQEIIQDVIQVSKAPSDKPIARQVATPDTRNVMKNVVPSGRAKRI